MDLLTASAAPCTPWLPFLRPACAPNPRGILPASLSPCLSAAYLHSSDPYYCLPASLLACLLPACVPVDLPAACLPLPPGVLVAVGVVDVLPRCLSSKYLFWDPGTLLRLYENVPAM